MGVAWASSARSPRVPAPRSEGSSQSLGVLAPDQHLELDAEREVGREGIIDDCEDDHV